MQANSKKNTPFRSVSFLEFETITSTNTWSKHNCNSFDPEKITCVYAHHQTEGRGRLSRTWCSPKGVNIYASFTLFVPKDFPYLPNLAQVLMCSALQVLKSRGLSPQMKWPNDLILNHRKLSGTLCEVESLPASNAAIIGIGLNVNMSEEQLHLVSQPATSLASETGRVWDWKELLSAIAEQFTYDLTTLDEEGFSPFAFLINKHLYKKNKIITISIAPAPIQGVCDHVNEDGSLGLLLESGEMKTIYSGDIKLAEGSKSSHLE